MFLFNHSTIKNKNNKLQPPSETNNSVIQEDIQEEGKLMIDVYENDSEFCIQAPIAGISEKDINISIQQEILIIKGERKRLEDKKEKIFFLQECYWGPFSRKIMIPKGCDAQRITTFFIKGILFIKIPKIKSTQ